MKKLLTVIIIFALISICLSGCADTSKKEVVLNITEENFLTLVPGIYEDSASYIGRTIKLEGICTVAEHRLHSHYYIYRNAAVYDSNHGHSHNQKLGFEFSYNGDMPKNNDWVEVTGTLGSRIENGNTYLVIEASSVKILNTRGAETIGDTDLVIHEEEDEADEHSH